MNPDSRIFVAGHRGLVGSAIVRALVARGHRNLLLRSSSELDLRESDATEALFARHKPEYVFLAAAKVGGIISNYRYPVEFLSENLRIQDNVIRAAHRHGVRRLLFLGSSCIYPRLAPQPMRESYLLTGPLEPTNRAYALAKIAGIELCWSMNRQYGTSFTAVMPTNLYGPGDNYHPENSHVIPGMLRRFHDAVAQGRDEVVVWGTGKPRREFLHSDDMADACIHLMGLDDDRFSALLGQDECVTGEFDPPLTNIGVGHDVTIAELAALIADVAGFRGRIAFDETKPDGTPRKLLDVSRIAALGWQAKTPLESGLRSAYADFLRHLANENSVS